MDFACDIPARITGALVEVPDDGVKERTGLWLGPPESEGLTGATAAVCIWLTSTSSETFTTAIPNWAAAFLLFSALESFSDSLPALFSEVFGLGGITFGSAGSLFATIPASTASFGKFFPGVAGFGAKRGLALDAITEPESTAFWPGFSRATLSFGEGARALAMSVSNIPAIPAGSS